MSITNSFLNLTDKDINLIHSWLTRINSNEITKTDIPCNYLKINRYYLDLHYISNKPTFEDYNDFRQQLGKFKNFKIIQDKFNTLLLMLIIQAVQINDNELFHKLTTFIALKFYSSLLHIYFPKFCNQNLWRETSRFISHKSLIKTQKSMSNFIKYIAENVASKYFRKLANTKKNINEKILMEYLLVLRHRLAQTLKAFAKVYYNIQKQSKPTTKIIDSEENLLKERKIDRAINVVSDMCNSNEIFEKALKIAVNRSGIKEDIARNIIREIFIPENINKFKLILHIYINKTHPDILCKEKGIIYYSSLIEKDIQIISNKYNLNDELEKIYIPSQVLMYKIPKNKISKLIFVYLLYSIYYKICDV